MLCPLRPPRTVSVASGRNPERCTVILYARTGRLPRPSEHLQRSLGIVR